LLALVLAFFEGEVALLPLNSGRRIFFAPFALDFRIEEQKVMMSAHD
jgi:hypothetical protein